MLKARLYEDDERVSFFSRARGELAIEIWSFIVHCVIASLVVGFALTKPARIFSKMKLGSVIGRVTLSKVVPELVGARWLIVSPFTREHFQRGSKTPAGLSKDPSLVVYDALGGGVGQTIGYIEGREAAQPFEQSPPIDAINAALIDEIFYNPVK